MNWSLLLKIMMDVAEVIAAIEAVFGPATSGTSGTLASSVIQASIAKNATTATPAITPAQQTALHAAIITGLNTAAKAAS